MQIPSVSCNPLPHYNGEIDLNQQDSILENPTSQLPIEAVDDHKIQLFDLDKKAFKQMIEGFETQLPELKKQLDNLEGRFFEVAMILRDLQELEEFYEKVQTTIDQIDELVYLAAMDQQIALINEHLVQLRNEYGELNHALNDYMRHKTPKIMDPFQEMIDKFLETGIEVPQEIRLDLTKSWKIIETLMRNCVPRLKLLTLQRKMRLFDQDVSDRVVLGRMQPLKLRNIGNSCYMDSVLQALLCDEAICEKISQPLVRGNLSIEDFRKKMAIQQELVKFIEAQQGNCAKGPYSQMEFALQLLKGPSLHDFRDAVFNSGFHMEFKRENLYCQLDAATFMDFLFDQFFMDCGFKFIEHAKIPEFPGLEYVKRPELMNILQIPFLTNDKGQKYKKIENLITLSLRPRTVHDDNPDDQRWFNPQEMKVVNPEEAARVSKDVGEVKVKEYTQFYKLADLPDVLTLHFKRFVHEWVPGRAVPVLRKVEDPVELPFAKNGIIDLSKHCETPDGKPLAYPVNYEIISYIVHSGGLQGGHYISFVKKGGKYWKCDDLDPIGYQEISKEEFFSGKEEYSKVENHPLNNARHPYLVVLKRLPTEEQEEGQVSMEKN